MKQYPVYRNMRLRLFEELRPDEGGLQVEDEVVDGAGDWTDVAEAAVLDEFFDYEGVVLVLLRLEMNLVRML